MICDSFNILCWCYNIFILTESTTVSSLRHIYSDGVNNSLFTPTHLFWLSQQQSLHSDTFILTESTTVSSLRHIYSDGSTTVSSLRHIYSDGVNNNLFSLYMIKSVNTIWKLSLGQYGKNQFNTDIFCIGPIAVSPITARSDSSRRFDNHKKKSREILDRLINKGLIRWCFSYWPSYRSSVWCIGIRLCLIPIQQPSDL